MSRNAKLESNTEKGLDAPPTATQETPTGGMRGRRARADVWLQGYLADKKLGPPPSTTIEAQAYPYCRDLGGDGFLYRREGGRAPKSSDTK